MKQNTQLLSFLGGEVSANALGRIDVEKLRICAETQVNWLPLNTGAMTFRPGLGYIITTKDNAACKPVPFVFGQTDTAVLLLTDSVMRVMVNDALLSAAPVATTVTNGDFSSGTGWTLTASTGATATISGGKLTLNAKAVNSSAYCERSTSVGSGDQGVEHRLRIVVTRGPVQFQIGSTSGADDLFGKTSLGTGTHSIAFTPGAAFYLRLSALSKIDAVVDSAQIEAAGTVELPTPWVAADLIGPSKLQTRQSGDIVFVWADGYQQRQIERRDNNSWSIVLYEPVGGPYTAKPEWAKLIRITPNVGVGGTGTLTATEAFFKPEDVNSIIAIDNGGFKFSQDLASLGSWIESIEVQGVSPADRTWSVAITGTYTGGLVCMRSMLGNEYGFGYPGVGIVQATAGVISVENFTEGSGTLSGGAGSLDDSGTHANTIAWYRWGFGSYTSGKATVTFTYLAGPETRGQARIIGYTSPTQVAVEEFATFFQTDTAYPHGIKFRMGEWSNRFGWPTTGEFHDGRLFQAGRDKIWGSVSDDFTNYDEEFEGDAAPINRSFGYGPFARVNWLLSLGRLLVGRENAVTSIRSSNFDAPLTVTDFTFRDCSQQGTFPLPAVKVGQRAVFIENSGRRVYELAYSVESNDYEDRDLTRLNADIGLPGFVAIAVQRQPDTRVFLVRSDGQVAVLSYEPKEGVEAWWRLQTDGVVEDVCVLPGDLEDQVYFVVKRTINGQTVRYIEKQARLDECTGGALCKLVDSFKAVSQSSSATITGLSHIEGEEVTVWANGKDLGRYTVASGQITVSEAVTSAIVGLPYEAPFLSAKLATAGRFGSTLLQKKKIDQLGLLLTNTHYQGLQFGPSFDRMDGLPLVEGGIDTPEHTIWTQFDAPMIAFPGEHSTDSRLALKAVSPRPVTVVAAVVGVDAHERY